MSITLLQGLLLTVIVFLFAWDARWERFFIFHPIVTCFVTGLVLGDVNLGLEAGAIAELSYLGLTTVGGTVPPNALMAGVMTVVLAYKNGISAEAALANDMKKYNFYVFLPEVILTCLYALVAFLSVYALQDILSNFVNSFPEFVSHGFEIAGGLLPGLGLALLLKVMLRKENVPYLIIGFLLMSILSLGNVLPIALFAVALAAIDFMKKKEDTVSEGGENDGEGI